MRDRYLKEIFEIQSDLASARRATADAAGQLARLEERLAAALDRLDQRKRRKTLRTAILTIIQDSGPRGVSSAAIAKRLEAAGMHFNPATLRSHISRLNARGEIEGRTGHGTSLWSFRDVISERGPDHLQREEEDVPS